MCLNRNHPNEWHSNLDHHRTMTYPHIGRPFPQRNVQLEELTESCTRHWPFNCWSSSRGLWHWKAVITNPTKNIQTGDVELRREKKQQQSHSRNWPALFVCTESFALCGALLWNRSSAKDWGDSFAMLNPQEHPVENYNDPKYEKASEAGRFSLPISHGQIVTHPTVTSQRIETSWHPKQEVATIFKNPFLLILETIRKKRICIWIFYNKSQNDVDLSVFLWFPHINQSFMGRCWRYLVFLYQVKFPPINRQ